MAAKPSATIVAAFITGLFTLLAALLTIRYGGGREEFPAERRAAPVVDDMQAAPLPDPANFEIYTSRLRFLARLKDDVHVVDFDDVRTHGSSQPVSIPNDRYKESTGAIISGEGGQYVDEDFGYPGQYQPASAPNLYAPGPISGGSGGGGRETMVTFSAEGGIAAVAGFGLYFIDADWPNWDSGAGQSSLTVYDRDHKVIASHNVSGGNREPVFAGIVTLGGQGKPIPKIYAAVIVNGSGWLGDSGNEGVALDGFVFGKPVAR